MSSSHASTRGSRGQLDGEEARARDQPAARQQPAGWEQRGGGHHLRLHCRSVPRPLKKREIDRDRQADRQTEKDRDRGRETETERLAPGGSKTTFASTVGPFRPRHWAISSSSFFITFGLELGDTKSLRALNTSPPWNWAIWRGVIYSTSSGLC